jgi:hypothetical protein
MMDLRSTFGFEKQRVGRSVRLTYLLASIDTIYTTIVALLFRRLAG